MSLESSIFDALKTLTSNRVYPDVAPAAVDKPYISYQQVGGGAVNFMESTAVGTRNARMQINCWATTRLAANALARSAEDALVTTLKATVLGALTSIYEEDTQLFGTRQDFGIWYS